MSEKTGLKPTGLLATPPLPEGAQTIELTENSRQVLSRRRQSGNDLGRG